MFSKPKVTITQTYSASTENNVAYLPTLILGKRYNVYEDQYLGPYVAGDYAYPQKGVSNTVESTSLTFKDIYLTYYTNAHTWKKIGTHSNRIRTILSDNLVIGEVGDKVVVNSTIETKIVDLVADQSPSSIGSTTALASNTATKAHSVEAAVAGDGQSGTTLASSGTYTGSLLQNVLSDSYLVTVSVAGNAPSIVADSPLLTNDYFDSSTPDNYRIIIVTSGALETATYQVVSDTGDNSGILVTPAAATLTDIGTKGLQFQFPDPISLVAGDVYYIHCTPSEARLSITTVSGKDDVSSRVFPGFGKAFSVGLWGVMATVTGSTMPLGYNWTIVAYKGVASVTATATGTYTGETDYNYFIRVIQGGAWGQCVVKVSGSERVITVLGYGSGNSISIGDGVQLYFATNTQGGLIYGDIFSVSCIAAKDIANRTLVLEDSLPDSTVTVGAASYTGTNDPHNTMAASGTYSEQNPGLELYPAEVYTITCTTIGAYGVAELTITTLSGNDNGTLTPASGANSYGSYGLVLTFAGTEAFALTDSWTVSVSKDSLDVDLASVHDDADIPKLRIEDQSQTAWSAGETTVTINSSIRVGESMLPVQSAKMYLTYKELHTTGVNTLTTDLGTSHVENPVKYGYDLARQYSTNVRAMYFTDIEKALGRLESLDSVYRICVMSHDNDIIDAVVAHANKVSGKNKWRVVYFSSLLPTELDITEGTATIHLNINDSNRYSLMKTTTADFSSVQNGDVVSYLSNTYIVKQVNSPTELVLVEDFGFAQSVPAAVSITRPLSTGDKVNYYKFLGAKYNNKRCVLVAPDTYNDTLPGYYLCAIIGGIKAGVHAHTPLSNTELSNVSVSYDYSEDQLDEIANAGILLIAQEEGAAYIRHQLTTDVSDVKHRELSMVEGYDAFSYGLLSTVAPFIGKYNAHPGVINQISTDVEAYCYRQTGSTTTEAGPLILSYVIDKLELTTEDKLLIQITITMAGPLNYIEVTLVV